MQCNGTVISGPNATDQPVVVGQQIVLTTPALPAGITATSTTWTVGGPNIGGYNPGDGNDSVLQTTLNQPSLTTYWINTGSAIPVTYQYCVNIPGVGNQCSLPSTATFDVSGPTVSMGTETSAVSVGLTPIELGFFVPPNTSGIVFNAIATQPDIPGLLIFVQLIDEYTGQYTSSNNCPAFNYGIGVDSQFPYDQSPVGATTYSTNDSPGIPLYSNDSAATANFEARMFLMWQPNTSSSIPVPMGYVTWNWSGEADQISNAWSVNSGSVVASSNPSFVSTTQFPTWDSAVIITAPPSCH
jgi:hypothetical protein